jgi:CHAT domain
MTTGRRRLGTIPLLATALGLPPPLMAQSQAIDDDLAWLHADDENAALARLRTTLATLPPERRSDYLRRLGEALRKHPPTALPGPGRRRMIECHRDLLQAHATVDPALIEWFATKAADFCSAGGDYDGGIAVIGEVAAMAPTSTQFLLPRRMQEIDYCIACLRLSAADARCEELETLATATAARADLLARRGSIDVMLGRLDQANRRLDTVARLLAEREAAGEDTAAEQFLLLCRRLDLMTAREQFASVRPLIVRFERDRNERKQPLTVEQRQQLELHGLAADYHATQLQPEGIAAAADGLEMLLAATSLPTDSRTLASLWLADLELRRGRPARAAAHLAVADLVPTRGQRWLSAAVRSELARASGGSADELARHEANLRSILREMIAEWRLVSWERESTGFLRLGARLRTLAELVAVTVALHGPEAALQDVLDVQCCTSLSRARAADTLPLVQLRQRVLRSDHGALVFVPAWNGSHVFAFDRDRLVHTMLPRAAELRRLTAALRQELLALDQDSVPAATVTALRQHSETLAETLLPPAVRELMANWSHVTITGGNLLGSPVFGCLPWDGDTLLGERFALATIGSLPLLVRLQEQAPDPTGHLYSTVVATLQPAPAFAERNSIGERLPLAGDRWQRLCAALPRGAQLLVDDAATVDAFLARATAAPARLSLLLAHGEQPLVDEPPALGLAPDDNHPDGALTPARIRAAGARGLVVLAACHAARGPQRMGDDDVADSLAGAFLFAGASAVVASPAPLRLSMHLETASALIAASVAGIEIAEAMRLARKQVGGSDWVQRYRAAQIELTGLGTAVLAPVAARSAPWLWFGGAALLGAVLLLWRRISSGPACR